MIYILHINKSRRKDMLKRIIKGAGMLSVLAVMSLFVVNGCGQELKKENEQLKATVSTLTEKNTKLENQVAGLQKENEDLKTKTEGLKGEKEALLKQLEDMKKKTASKTKPTTKTAKKGKKDKNK